MLKEDPRYDYSESSKSYEAETVKQIRARRRKPRGPSLPVGTHSLQAEATLPLQSYLQERFAHIGDKNQRLRYLRAENQRRHDLAASRGGWQMSRTS